MIEICEYTKDYETAWDSYVEKSPQATIAHQISWFNAMRDGLSHRPRYLMALEDDIVKGILPLMLVTTWWQTRYIISLPWIDYGGICANNSEISERLLAEACQIAISENARFIELRSIDIGLDTLATRKDKVTFLLSLDSDPDKIWKSFSGKLRNQIRKSQKSDLILETGRGELLPEFYRIFAWKMRDLGTPVWSLKFFKSILNEFSERAEIALVKKENKSIAGGLLLKFKDKLYVPSAAAYRSALKYCPNHALYWGLIKYGCEQNYKCFDFGRSTIDSPTYKFKQQWVSTPTQLNWQYYLNKAKDVPSINPDNAKYRLLINLWRKLPLPIANYLGPKVIKNFP